MEHWRTRLTAAFEQWSVPDRWSGLERSRSDGDPEPDRSRSDATFPGSPRPSVRYSERFANRRLGRVLTPCDTCSPFPTSLIFAFARGLDVVAGAGLIGSTRFSASTLQRSYV